MKNLEFLEETDKKEVEKYVNKFKLIFDEIAIVEKQMLTLKKKWEFVNTELENARKESDSLLIEIANKYNMPLKELENKLL